jgi:hypothetical protein
MKKDVFLSCCVRVIVYQVCLNPFSVSFDYFDHNYSSLRISASNSPSPKKSPRNPGATSTSLPKPSLNATPSIEAKGKAGTKANAKEPAPKPSGEVATAVSPRHLKKAGAQVAKGGSQSSPAKRKPVAEKEAGGERKGYSIPKKKRSATEGQEASAKEPRAKEPGSAVKKAKTKPADSQGELVGEKPPKNVEESLRSLSATHKNLRVKVGKILNEAREERKEAKKERLAAEAARKEMMEESGRVKKALQVVYNAQALCLTEAKFEAWMKRIQGTMEGGGPASKISKAKAPVAPDAKAASARAASAPRPVRAKTISMVTKHEL